MDWEFYLAHRALFFHGITWWVSPVSKSPWMNVQWVHPQGYSKGDRFEMMLTVMCTVLVILWQEQFMLILGLMAYWALHYTYLESDPLVSPCNITGLMYRNWFWPWLVRPTGQYLWSKPVKNTFLTIPKQPIFALTFYTEESIVVCFISWCLYTL